MPDFHFSPRTNRAHEIHWQEWGAHAFSQAEQADKPILLAISAVWCHWCHVMDETTYSDPKIIEQINSNFIPVRVDNDARPDVNRRYNLGGWPTTAFLTPDGELLTGGTYIPPEQMQSYLTQVHDVYENSKEQIKSKVAEIRDKREQLHTAKPVAAALDEMIVENIAQEALTNLDPVFGGFGDEPKFPQADVLELLLERHVETRDRRLLNAATLTLDHMASGGMYDQVGGGFFRYSTTRDWRIPHYEKMLEDNAKLLAIYVHGYQITQQESYLKTIRTLVAYVEQSLSNPDGGFYGSQDADETFYTLPAERRSRVAAPYIDKTFYTDWNALMVSAFLDAAHVLPGSEGDVLASSRLQSFALKTLDRLWNEMFRPGEGLYHSRRPDGTPQLLGQLVDLARTTAAFVDAYQATGNNSYLQRAGILADHALATLHDPASGAFWNDLPRGDAPGLLRISEHSIGDNALIADALIRFYRLNGDEKYRDAADKALSFFAGDYEKSSFMAADYARAISHLVHEPVAVHIVGPVDSPATQGLQAAALKQFAPDKVIQVLDPVRDNTRITQLGYPAGADPVAYVCVGTTCLPPVSDAQGVQDQIQRFLTE